MSDEQCIQGVDSAWRQFRFSVGAPDAEATFQKALQNATTTDANAKKYPSLYPRPTVLQAFHGLSVMGCGIRLSPAGVRSAMVSISRRRRRRRWGTTLRVVGWKHNADYVRRTIELLMPPPFESSPSATMAVQRELKTMLKEQDKAMTSPGGLKELGWYMPQEFMGDDLFQWIMEMQSLPPTYPIGPPFFRIIAPRFLPFIQSGGVTSRAVCPLASTYKLISHFVAGGSTCMDLLTSDGWLPSYSISAVLMQIKLMISDLDPRPARLASNWNTPYPVSESLVGFKRASATHGWTVPEGLEKLAI
ncbi:hypothetical protein B0H14DRAFT_3133745 [Mycena olivaceomarginata]|nr:hypothetical protein B0H14DRAFT_3133745 [Mycena olivaceomarginata]